MVQTGVVESRVDDFSNYQFANDVLRGLQERHKRLMPKYFYDKKGSTLFDQICELEEYYPYKTELALLPRVVGDLSKKLQGKYAVVEFGAGSLLKIRPLLSKIAGIEQFVPIDISGDHLHAACDRLLDEFPEIDICPIEADFCKPVDIGDISQTCIGYFPGSTIGNFTPDEAGKFLENARQTLGEQSYMLVGVDTKKSTQALHHAYNDKKGVTSEFNLNILRRINEELGGNFRMENFEHYACYDAVEGCVKMFLISLKDQVVEVMGREFVFTQGEPLHTESSYKYTLPEFTQLFRSAGWTLNQYWLAEKGMFSIYLLSA